MLGYGGKNHHEPQRKERSMPACVKLQTGVVGADAFHTRRGGGFL